MPGPFVPSAVTTAILASLGAILDTDFSGGEGFMRKTGSGAYETIKSNLSAVTDPGIGDDSGAGYAIGSLWINTATDAAWTCVDASAGAAVWSGGGGGGKFFGKTVYLDADGNGDATTFTAAVALLNAGDRLWIAPGTYTFVTETIPAGCVIQGSGIDVTILTPTTTLNALNGSGRFDICDLTMIQQTGGFNFTFIGYYPLTDEARPQLHRVKFDVNGLLSKSYTNNAVVAYDSLFMGNTSRQDREAFGGAGGGGVEVTVETHNCYVEVCNGTNRYIVNSTLDEAHYGSRFVDDTGTSAVAGPIVPASASGPGGPRTHHFFGCEFYDFTSIVQKNGSNPVEMVFSGCYFEGLTNSIVKTTTGANSLALTIVGCNAHNFPVGALTGRDSNDVWVWPEGGFDDVLAVNRGEVLRSYVEIGNAAVLTLNTTPVEIVPNPGAGKFIEIESIQLWHDFATAGFAAGGDLVVEYATNNTEIARQTYTGFLTAASDQNRLLYPASPAVTTAQDLIPDVNSGVDLTCLTANPTTGGGVLKVETFYRVRSSTPAE